MWETHTSQCRYDLCEADCALRSAIGVEELTTSVNFRSFCVCPPQILYKKGHDQRKAKYTSLANPPEMELAKRVAHQRSDVR